MEYQELIVYFQVTAFLIVVALFSVWFARSWVNDASKRGGFNRWLLCAFVSVCAFDLLLEFSVQIIGVIK